MCMVCARNVHVHGYAPLKLLSCLVRTPKKGSPSAMVKLILCDHEVMSSSPGKSLVEMQRKSVYIRPKVVGLFPGSCARGAPYTRLPFFITSNFEGSTFLGKLINWQGEFEFSICYKHANYVWTNHWLK
jgi:hypothetical protein